MKRLCGAIAAAALILAGVPVAQVRAAPPTVTPSPGYDARLQEQRAAAAAATPARPLSGRLDRPVDRYHPARRAHAPIAPLSRNSEGW